MLRINYFDNHSDGSEKRNKERAYQNTNFAV